MFLQIHTLINLNFHNDNFLVEFFKKDPLSFNRFSYTEAYIVSQVQIYKFGK